MWKAFIQFGPVHVPVKLYSAVKDIRTHSHLLHDQDRVRLQQQMVCSEEQERVPRKERIKGYEIEDDEYVVIDPGELDVLEPDASREIEVDRFVDVAAVDPRYLDRTYYLGPDADDQMYANLAESLRGAKLAGVCHWVMRKKSYAGILDVRDSLLTLTTHRYADEVVPEDSLDIPSAKTSKKEKAIARNLVDELVEQFHPEQYHDEYEIKLRALIEQKARGKEVSLPKLKKARATREEDLVGALERSLEALRK